MDAEFFALPIFYMIKRITALGFASFAMWAATAQGAIITDSATFGPQAPGTPSFTVALDKFNPALGTLLSVTLVLDLRTAGSTFTFDNETAAPGPVTLTFAVGASATSGGPAVLSLNTQVLKTGTGSVLGDDLGDGSGDFTGPDSFSISGAGTAQSFTTQSAAAFLSQYTAAVPGETFLVTVSNFNSTSTSAVFGPTSVVGGTFAGAVTVGYNYLLAAVPEAATAFWGGLVGLFALTRRVRTRLA